MTTVKRQDVKISLPVLLDPSGPIQKELIMKLKPCLQCAVAPYVHWGISDITNEKLLWIECVIHGHKACGSTEESAIAHWNRYIRSYSGIFSFESI